METQEKLELIVDRLLVKTQDNLCNWIKAHDDKYGLKTGVANLFLYDNTSGGTIALDVSRDSVVLATIRKNKSDENSNLVRLFNAVSQYHTNYINGHLTKMLEEIDKLGTQPF